MDRRPGKDWTWPKVKSVCTCFDCMPTRTRGYHCPRCWLNENPGGDQPDHDTRKGECKECSRQTYWFETQNCTLAR